MPGEPEGKMVELGRVLRPHGVNGAFVISAYTENPVLGRPGLELWSPDGRERRPAGGLAGRTASGRLVVKLPGLESREEAAALKGWRLVLPRNLLPPLPDDEIYWTDLIGLAVSTTSGLDLGRVEGLLEAGAGLILSVIDPAGLERLIPFQPDCLAEVDLADGRLVLDPPPGLLDI